MLKKLCCSFTFILLATAIFVAASWPANNQQSSTPSGSGSSQARSKQIRGYTDNTKYLDHCFPKERYNSKPVYFKIYAPFPIKDKSNIQLYLYTFYQGKSVDVTPGNINIYIDSMDPQSVTISASDMRPPHLGSGPYMASITASGTGKGGSSTALFWYYYDTWATDPNECMF
jgi:hypothetical protein